MSAISLLLKPLSSNSNTLTSLLVTLLLALFIPVNVLTVVPFLEVFIISISSAELVSLFMFMIFVDLNSSPA